MATAWLIIGIYWDYQTFGSVFLISNNNRYPMAWVKTSNHCLLLNAHAHDDKTEEKIISEEKIIFIKVSEKNC